MKGLYDYMTESEYELACIEAVFENQMAHLEHEWKLLMLESELNMHSIETKILMESGTDDDMAYLYAMEAEDTANKGAGILTKMVNAILGFLKRIKEALFGAEPKEEDLPKEVKVDDPKGIMKAWEAIKSNPAAAAAAVAAIAGGVVLTKNAIIPTLKDLKTVEQQMEEQMKSWKEEISKIEAKEKKSKKEEERLKELKEQLSSTQGLLNKLSRTVKALTPGTAENDQLKDAADERKEAEQEKKEEEAEKKKNQAEQRQQKKQEKQNAKADKKSDKLHANASEKTRSVAELDQKERQLLEELAKAERDEKKTSIARGDIKDIGTNAKAATGKLTSGVVEGIGKIRGKLGDHTAEVTARNKANEIRNKSNADERDAAREDAKDRISRLNEELEKIRAEKARAVEAEKTAKSAAKDFDRNRK